jgi:hypothetical protein
MIRASGGTIAVKRTVSSARSGTALRDMKKVTMAMKQSFLIYLSPFSTSKPWSPDLSAAMVDTF